MLSDILKYYLIHLFSIIGVLQYLFIYIIPKQHEIVFKYIISHHQSYIVNHTLDCVLEWLYFKYRESRRRLKRYDTDL